MAQLALEYKGTIIQIEELGILVAIVVIYIGKTYLNLSKKLIKVKLHSHCADVAMVHPDAGQPVYREHRDTFHKK